MSSSITIHIRSSLTLGLEMAAESAVLTECLAAVSTAKWLLACVSPDMTGEACLLPEPFTAHLTRPRHVGGVRALVHFK